MMVIVSIPPNAEFGPNDHREDAPHFKFTILHFTLDPKFHEVSLNIRKGIEAKNYDETVRKYKKSQKTLLPQTCLI